MTADQYEDAKHPIRLLLTTDLLLLLLAGTALLAMDVHSLVPIGLASLAFDPFSLIGAYLKVEFITPSCIILVL